MQNPSLCFIGCGNLATQLSIALMERGFYVAQVYSRTELSATALAKRLRCLYTTNPTEITDAADVYICALKDSVIDEVLSQASIRGKVIVHTAGSVPMSQLATYTDRMGVFYPMQTFSKEREVDFSKIPMLLEASSSEVMDLLEAMARSLSSHIYHIDSEQRRKMHLAAVFACNFTNHLYALAEELAQRAGLPFETLLPLIEETADKVHELSPRVAQTGPAVRYDLNVIERQMAMLDGDEMMKRIYETISQSIHKVATETNK